MNPVTLNSGDRLVLRCNVSGDPEPSVDWFKDSKNLRDNDRATMKNRAGMCSLTIADVTSLDSGEYSCKARNEEGETDIRTTVNVEDKVADTVVDKVADKDVDKVADKVSSKSVSISNDLPYFVKHPQGKILTDGDSTMIECEVRGATEIVWYKGNEVIMENEDFKYETSGDTYRLHITEVFPEDSGTYRAEACNVTGTESSHFTLFVNVPEEEPSGPSFREFPKSQNVSEGTPVTFSCEVDYLGSVTWMKDTRILDDSGRFKITTTDTSSTFTIPAALATDTGTYYVEVNNDKGNTVWTFTLHVDVSISPCADIDVLSLIKAAQC